VAWQKLNKTWQDTTVDYCDVCGNLLIVRYWSFTDEQGREFRSCDPSCERLLARLRRSRA
jgi:hypothetical protein